MQPPAPTTQQRNLYRANIIYFGKSIDKNTPHYAFVDAVSKEAAMKFMEDTLSPMKKYGYKYKIEIYPSSDGEMKYVLQTVKKREYTGIVN